MLFPASQLNLGNHVFLAPFLILSRLSSFEPMLIKLPFIHHHAHHHSCPPTAMFRGRVVGQTQRMRTTIPSMGRSSSPKKTIRQAPAQIRGPKRSLVEQAAGARHRRRCKKLKARHALQNFRQAGLLRGHATSASSLYHLLDNTILNAHSTSQ